MLCDPGDAMHLGFVITTVRFMPGMGGKQGHHPRTDRVAVERFMDKASLTLLRCDLDVCPLTPVGQCVKSNPHVFFIRADCPANAKGKIGLIDESLSKPCTSGWSQDETASLQEAHALSDRSVHAEHSVLLLPCKQLVSYARGRSSFSHETIYLVVHVSDPSDARCRNAHAARGKHVGHCPQPLESKSALATTFSLPSWRSVWIDIGQENSRTQDR